MSETNIQTTPTSTSRINLAIEAVINLINTLGLFATMTRGALGSKEGLAAEIGPTSPETVFLDKHQYIPVDLTINGKHSKLRTLTDAMNLIHEYLTMLTQYPSGDGWAVVDITTLTEPQVIAREEENQWLMASALLVKVQTFDKEPTPEPEPEPEPEQNEGE